MSTLNVKEHFNRFKCNGRQLADGIYQDAQGFKFKIKTGEVGDPIGSEAGRGLYGVYSSDAGVFELEYFNS
jgi:hypothetical protein